MFYNISRTLEIMPYISWSVLLIVWLFIENKCYKEQLSDEPQTEPGRENFILPPGAGYEYYVSSNSIVYILRKARKCFRIYIVQGDNPGVKIKKTDMESTLMPDVRIQEVRKELSIKLLECEVKNNVQKTQRI